MPRVCMHKVSISVHNRAFCVSTQSSRADVAPGTTMPPQQPLIRKRLQKLSELKLRPEQVLIRDKLGFFLGVVNLWYSHLNVLCA